jgi:hypothetical protein
MAAKIDTGTSFNSGIGNELSSFKEIRIEYKR